MTKDEIKEFKTFMKSRRLWSKFVIEARYRIGCLSVENHLLYNITYPRNALEDTIYFSSSADGVMYWHDISIEWNKHITKLVENID